ncbi:MAG: signal peptidase I, partial [Verrucomicrobia bacterium]|nr:signal peptidase I [Verrucomicrobiota bacterium]
MKSLIKNKNHKKLREKAENWLRLAEKVYHYRKDVIAKDDMKELHESSSTLNKALEEKGNEDWGKVRLASEELEAVLTRVGGFFYPQNFWAENSEMFLVAAIVALAIRTFFLQPFKIPTNSMYPSYNGMTHEVYEPGEGPGGLAKIFTFLAWGSLRREVIAKDSGEVLIPIDRFQDYFKKVPGRKWLVLPTTVHEYGFQVGEEKVSFKVPAEFSPYEVFKDAFFPDEEGDWGDMISRFRSQGRLVSDGRTAFVRTGKKVNKGDTALSFAIHTGDALFVDRMSYHFIRPDVGDGIVFRTENIPATGDDKYYIKRLVGVPGDELQVKAPALYRNGELITGADAFAKNATQEGEYSGYSFRNNSSMRYLRTPSDKVTIPEDSFFAMGDNSPHSSDSRYWGFVPKKEMVGRAI